MVRMRRQCAILVVIALAACSKPAPAPAPPTRSDAGVGSIAPADATPLPLDEDLPRLALRAVELYEEIVRLFGAAASDCAAATEKLRTARPAYAEVAAANAKVLHEGRAKALRAALEPHGARLDAAAKMIASGPTMAACAADRAFTDAFDALVGAP